MLHKWEAGKVLFWWKPENPIQSYSSSVEVLWERKNNYDTRDEAVCQAGAMDLIREDSDLKTYEVVWTI